MTIPEILKELEPYTGRFPMKAMKAAIEQREAITPELLGIVEAIAEKPTEYARRQDNMAHIFALYLLAQFRETRAYPAIVKMFSTPGETPFDLAGDTVTEGLSQIFASVYDGNPALLHSLVENEQVNEYVRSAALDTFLVLEHTGQMPRDTVVEYFRSLFQGKLQRKYSYAWVSLVCAVADLPAPELLEEVRRVYDEDLVDSTAADLDGIERDVVVPRSWRHDRHYIITDAIAEMEGWASFHPEPSRPKKAPKVATPVGTIPPRAQLTATMEEVDREIEALMRSSPPIAPPSSHVAPQPIVRQPKIGRNDPCLCGSGKKYKKCCGKG